MNGMDHHTWSRAQARERRSGGDAFAASSQFTASAWIIDYPRNRAEIRIAKLRVRAENPKFMGVSTDRDADVGLVKQCLAGEATAWAEFKARYQPLLADALIKQGASLSEATDIVADLLGDCVPGGERPSLLERYEAKSALFAWLRRIALNRFIDRKRRGKFNGELPVASEDYREDPFDLVAAPAESLEDPSVTDLVTECVQAAFAECPADALLMLRLVYLHSLSQRDVGRMWGWHESKVSRRLSQAMEQIKSSTLRQIAERDAKLTLTWEDLLGMCKRQIQL